MVRVPMAIHRDKNIGGILLIAVILVSIPMAAYWFMMGDKLGYTVGSLWLMTYIITTSEAQMNFNEMKEKYDEQEFGRGARRKRQGKFNPNRDYVKNAVDEYLKSGGTIDRIESSEFVSWY